MTFITKRNADIYNYFLFCLLCKSYYKSLKCRSCKKLQLINNKMLKTAKKNPKKLSNKTIKVWQKYNKMCDKCSTSKNTKKCNPTQFKKY